MENLKEILAKNVFFFREKKEMTQDELAEAVGISVGMIRKIEYQQAWPSAEILSKLSNVLECNFWELFYPPDTVKPSMEDALFRGVISKLSTALDKDQIRSVFDYINSTVLHSMTDYYEKKEKEVMAKMEAKRLLPRTNIKRKVR